MQTTSRLRLHLAAILVATAAAPVQAQSRFTLESALSYAFPSDLAAARAAGRIAWVENHEGARNLFTALAPAFEPKRLTDTADDDGHDMTGVQLSADGSVIAYIRGHTPNGDGWIANPTSDPRGAERAVWAVNTAGGRPWRVVEAEGFALSPDGRWVLYAKEGQIHRAAVNPGLQQAERTDDAPPLFRAYGENDNPVWSPDGGRIAFVSSREDHSFIGVYDAGRPNVTYVAPAVDRDNSPAWSPGGERIAFIRRPGLPFGARAQRKQNMPDSMFTPGLVNAKFAGGHTLEIWVADATTGVGRMLWQNAPGEEERFGEVRRIAWAGDDILFEAEPGNWRHWFTLSTTKQNAQPMDLTPGEGFVEYVDVSPDGRWLYYAANIGDMERRHVWRVRTSGGKAEQLTKGDGIETMPVVPGGDRIATLVSSTKQPLAVAVVDANGGTPRVLSPAPQSFPMARQVVPRDVVIEAADGVKAHSQLFLPPDMKPGEKRPALLFIHGGSRRQMLLGYHYMYFYHMAYAVNQYFANKGYVVMSVNYRSGIGYGREFRTAEKVGRQGNSEYQDVLAAGKYLRDRADVDPARVGVWGLSYGGILTAQALARNSDVFAAGVDIAGVHLWGNTIDPDAVSFKASSISEIENWKSPVLLVHGDDDRNVDFSQTVGLVQLLRAHDVPFELIVYPDDVHDSLLHRHWLRTLNATDDFFERHLKPATRTADGGGR